jgi:hypothetical protein
VSGTYISAELRRLVVARADGLCEYCLIHSDDTFFGCEVDHIQSEKHGGPTDEANLALACLFCNRNKGSDIASVVPRSDRWGEHFRLGLDGITVVPMNEIGEATVRILGINAGERLMERDALRVIGRYPSPEAVQRLTASTP